MFLFKSKHNGGGRWSSSGMFSVSHAADPGFDSHPSMDHRRGMDR